MNKIYNIDYNACGIYLITNKLNNKKYVGASVNIPARLSTHFGRDSKKYFHHAFYDDIRKYGRDSFTWEVLEICDKTLLLEREQYYYDSIKPEYNIIRPTKCSFYDPITRKHAIKYNTTPEATAKKRELYNTPKYKEIFSHIQDKRKKQVIMFNDNISLEFKSLSDCAKWIDEHTTFKGKNKVSKIKAVCDGERKIAYGYKFKYKNTSNDYLEREYANY